MGISANILAVIAVMAVATFATRVAPFAVLHRKADHPVVRYLGRYVPAIVLPLLTLYCVKGVRVDVAPHGLPEILAVATVVALHLVFRNALISIGAGTGLFMIFQQTGLLAAL
jgi:branched-subunit amino acid transport protein AzlD